MKKKRMYSILAALIVIVMSLNGCSPDSKETGDSRFVQKTGGEASGQEQAGQEQAEQGQAEQGQATPGETLPGGETAALTEKPVKAPKYIFLFIGDGMSYPQIQLAADYRGAMQDKDYMQALPSRKDNEGSVLDGPEPLAFMDFQAAGSTVNYNTNSFIPDSASAGTAIASGHKTYAGHLNTDEQSEVEYETIAEKVRKQKGMKVGIISTVNLNHATPAAFYAHQSSRTNYYQIGMDLIASGFDYFAGGNFLQPRGGKKNKKSLYKQAKQAGYAVARTQEEAADIRALPAIITVGSADDGDDSMMPYELDRDKKEWSLADYLKKGTELLDNEKGFFIMCEGGKIDLACHANDAASALHDTLAFADAVSVAVEFAQKHKEETLIVVTGDHETGGLTIGAAETKYDTYLSLLDKQKISFEAYDSEYVSTYKKEKTDFGKVLKHIEKLFGLKTSGKKSDRMVLNEEELERLKTAYQISVLKKNSGMSKKERYKAYGKYEPLTVTITHIMGEKAGISFTTYSHTALTVGVFADGVNAEVFNGYYDNTEIYKKFAAMLEIE